MVASAYVSRDGALAVTAGDLMTSAPETAIAARLVVDDTPQAEQPDEQATLFLVASSGGHLLEMLSLRRAWERHERVWVTFATQDAVDLLEGEGVIWAFHPTNRNLRNLVRNLLLAWRTLRRERPDALFSTGAGIAVPFIWIAWLLRIPTTYVESLTRIHRLSLSGRLVYPVSSHFYVQWPELTKQYPRAQYWGRIL